MTITHIIPHEVIQNRIFLIRGKKIIFDKDLAELYGTTTGTLLQAVKRNKARFPTDFLFQLTKSEFISLKSHFVISKGRGGTRKLPFAFTEHGILMLSSVLNSEKAILVNIEIMRTFTRLREMLASHKELRQKIEDIEQKYDHQFKVVFEAIKQLLSPPQKSKEPLGFRPLRP